MSYIADVVAAASSFDYLFRPEWEIHADKRRTYGTINFKVKADEFRAAWPVICGTVESVGVSVGGTGATINRVIPLRHPWSPKMIAETANASFVGHNQKTGADGFYSWCKVQVNFATPDYDIEGDDAFLTVSTRPSGRAINVPTAAFSVGGFTAMNGTRFIPGYTYEIMLHKFPYFDVGLYQGISRSVNSAPWRGCPAGCAMFLGPTTTRTSTVLGVTSYEIGLAFDISSIPWNQELGADGLWYDCTFNGTNLWYPEVDFSQLFPIANIS